MAIDLPDKPFRAVNRFITRHQDDGKTTFATPVSEDIAWDRSEIGADFFLCYSLSSFPIPLTNDSDLNTYASHLQNKPPFMIPDGGVVRYVDFHPACEPIWHRTVTLDIGIVVEGQMCLELDSGEKRIMERGDVAIQRGTSHCWHNTSKTEFARVLFVALSADPVVVNGEALGESLGRVSGH